MLTFRVFGPLSSNEGAKRGSRSWASPPPLPQRDQQRQQAADRPEQHDQVEELAPAPAALFPARLEETLRHAVGERVAILWSEGVRFLGHRRRTVWWLQVKSSLGRRNSTNTEVNGPFCRRNRAPSRVNGSFGELKRGGTRVRVPFWRREILRTRVRIAFERPSELFAEVCIPFGRPNLLFTRVRSGLESR